MHRVDVWSTDEELEAKALHPKADPEPYLLSSDGWAWAIIACLCIIVAALFVAVHDLGAQVKVLKDQAAHTQTR